MTILSGSEPDPFGAALRQAFAGHPAAVTIRRDDGLVNQMDMAYYLAGANAFHPTEAVALDNASGRVLDIGCGGGRHALHLRDQILSVTGLDVSPSALWVAGHRGLSCLVWASVSPVPFARGSFDTLLLLGGNLGIGGTVAGSRDVLRSLRRLVGSDGRLLASSRNVLGTADPVHLAYHERNRDRGLSAGQLRLRMEYGDLVGPWFDLLFPTPAEVPRLIEGSGWRLQDLLEDQSPVYSAVLTADSSQHNHVERTSVRSFFCPSTLDLSHPSRTQRTEVRCCFDR
jgi:SAM-dependent methyltransferase